MNSSSEEKLTNLKEKRTKLSGSARNAAQGSISNLDDLLTRKEVNITVNRTRTESSLSELRSARETTEQTQKELGELCADLNEELSAIGYEVDDVYNYKGMEWVWSKVGLLGFQSALNKARQMRMTRLENQSTKESVRLISDLSVDAATELRISQKEYEADVVAYEKTEDAIITKLKDATPLLQKFKTERESLDLQIKDLKRDLDAGLISETDLPEKEGSLTELKRQYQAALLQETDCLEIINNAKRAIPELEKNIEAAKGTIIALNQMCRGLMEKIANFGELLERCMTSVKTLAKLEGFNVVDPAYNKAVTSVSKTNISMFAAASQLVIDRSTKSAISPEESEKLFRKLETALIDFMQGVVKLEEEASEGIRRPVSSVAENNNAERETTSAKSA